MSADIDDVLHCAGRVAVVMRTIAKAAGPMPMLKPLKVEIAALTNAVEQLRKAHQTPTPTYVQRVEGEIRRLRSEHDRMQAIIDAVNAERAAR